MYCLTIRKSCKALKALQVCQMAYGFIIDSITYKTIYKVYGFDALEIPVIAEYVNIKKEELING